MTARHSGERLQDAPVAISALTGQQLSNQGVSSLADLSRSVPSVSLNQSFGGYGKSVIAFVRGVGQGDFLPAFEPGVGFYINDVYQGTIFGSLADLSDVDRVEVLRGPQGTLFGKSNEGGAVRIFTPQPRGSESGYIQAGYGSYNRRMAKGAYDATLIPDTLFLRIAGGVNSIDGYVDRIDYACAHPATAGTIKATKVGDCKVGSEGGDDAKVARADLRWIVSPSLEMTFSADMDDDRGEPSAEKLLAVNTAATGLTAANSGYGIAYDSRFITNNLSTYTSYTDQKTGVSFPAVNNVFSWGVSHALNWRTPWGVQVKNTLAYRKYNGEFTEIWSNAPIQADDNYFKPEHNQFSEELQVLGKAFHNRLDWVTGLYYYDAHTELNDFIYLPEFSFAFYGKDPVHDSDKSIFLHGVYHLTDKLNVEAGIRHTSEEKLYTFNRYLTSIFGAVPAGATIPGFEHNPQSKASTDRNDYRFSLQYKFTPDLMAYVQYATGFKGGGINPRPSGISDVHPFAAEDLVSYEAGVKSEWFERRLRVNVDGYFSDYTNLQLSIPVFSNGAAGSTVSNAGKVHINGAELEVQAAPIKGMLINASYDYLNYDIIDLGAAAGLAGGPAKGDLAPFVPETKFNIGAQQSFTTPIGVITPRLDWTWQSKTYSDAANSPLTLQKAYGVLDAHLLFETADHKWKANLEVKNLTNQAYYLNKFSQYNTAGMVVGQPARPRTVFLTLQRSFQ
ncbi:TonB-dependent receptor [Phenylobacterium montanum]|uniref:TonB-dependent receptor n=1 Tax=Phenylobacterium montanum TaxID=2823693 RepID=A0A975G494_9CAUL|nr:TonB-dependent receptor [Caulobacter sp. S6]QUD90252.1 TonB-dependent receptor [Caulobacter sp. S6]